MFDLQEDPTDTTTQAVQPTLRMVAELPDGVTMEDVATTMAINIALQLNTSLESISVSVDARDERRRLQTQSVEATISISGLGNAGVTSMGELVSQLSDPNSPLMAELSSSGITVPPQSLTTTYECPLGARSVLSVCTSLLLLFWCSCCYSRSISARRLADNRCQRCSPDSRLGLK
eukprot:SAG11_NODE_13745_length_641_cov_1.651292_1_plen_175_part_10